MDQQKQLGYGECARSGLKHREGINSKKEMQGVGEWEKERTGGSRGQRKGQTPKKHTGKSEGCCSGAEVSVR